MSKKQTKTQDDFESELKSEVAKVEASYDSIAITITPKLGGWNIVKITLDPKTLELGQATIVDTAESKDEANEKFKIAVVRNKVI